MQKMLPHHYTFPLRRCVYPNLPVRENFFFPDWDGLFDGVDDVAGRIE